MFAPMFVTLRLELLKGQIPELTRMTEPFTNKNFYFFLHEDQLNVKKNPKSI